MKNNSLVFLGFVLICLMNLNSHHRVSAKKPVQPASSPATLAAVPMQPKMISSPTSTLAVIPAETVRKSVSVSRPVALHKLRDRQSEASMGPVDASDSVPKDDKLARPL
jgi:hypothetical protein